MTEGFGQQVQLLVQILPYVGREAVFALKGGTAINLFYRDLPRLSVDIDLTDLPIRDRTESLLEIHDALHRIADGLRRSFPGILVRPTPDGNRADTRLLIQQGRAVVKIETTPVLRGVVHETGLKRVVPTVENRFGFAEIPVVAFPDLFAGKLVAAMDRQHPRDLFDVMLLYENEGISDELFRTFLVYVASSSRPIDELFEPRFADLAIPFEQQFKGMTNTSVSCRDLEDTRRKMVADLRGRLDIRSKRFLLGLHDCNPDFSLIDLPQAAKLPAIRWKLLNLETLMRDNPDKHREQRMVLERALD